MNETPLLETAQLETALLEAKGIIKNFGERTILAGINLAIEPGEIRAIIGPNGAGKTTFFNIISGLLEPNQGQVLFRGERISGWPPHRIARLGIARTTQRTSLFPELTVTEHLLLAGQGKQKGGNPLARGLSAKKMKKITEKRLEQTGLSHLGGSPAWRLDHGRQRRLEIAMALAGSPQLLLLDEPAAGLSQEESNDFRDLILRIQKEELITILIIEHDMEMVMALAKRITVFHQGRALADGTPAEIKTNTSVQEIYLGEEKG